MSARVLYVDCFSGVAGDMFLGALLDLGVEQAGLMVALDSLGLDGWSIEVGPTHRQTIAATRAQIVLVGLDGPEPHVHPHGHRWMDVRALIEGAGLPGPVRDRAVATFRRLAQAEAKAHGVALEAVHFHEVGAVDSILDVVGTCWGLWSLGLDRVVSAPPPLGRGMVQTAHGRMPLPAPATLALLHGVPIAADAGDKELVTPTGAALLRAWADDFGTLPAMIVDAIGWGAGRRELPDRPNLLRLVLGHEATAAPDCVVIEANVDDMTPELAGWLLERLFAAGALDAWFVPLHMKKSRPAFMVSALAEPAGAPALEEVLLRESTAIGLRRYPVQRHVLPRRMVEVVTPFGTVPIKVAERDGAVLNAAPEHAACARLATEHGVPLKTIYQHAVAAWLAVQRS